MSKEKKTILPGTYPEGSDLKKNTKVSRKVTGCGTGG